MRSHLLPIPLLAFVSCAVACGKPATPSLDVDALTTGATYYVATDGNDANPGTLTSPLRTIDKAVSLVGPGDTIELRGGTYSPSSAIVLARSGTSGNRILLHNYGTEVVTLDFANNPRHANPPRPRIDDSIAATGDAIGILITADWWHLEGFAVRNAAYYGVRVYGSHNIIERVDVGFSKAAGFEITGKDNYTPSDNLIVSCDSHDNFDPQGNGEDADGFGVKFETIGPGNILRDNRGYRNSDDGYDFWHAAEPVTIEGCWAFANGFNRPEWSAQLTGPFAGDGFGFKLGQDAAALQLTRVVAWGNKGFGIDENGNRSSGVLIDHATLFANAKDGVTTQISLNDGSAHTVTNSIAFDIDAGFSAANAIEKTAAVQDAFNSWTLPVTVDVNDFVNADVTTLNADGESSRSPSGGLPLLGLRLRTDSDLIDQGTPTSSRPDLGAFELQ